ncbi:MAG: TAT-variant-translocated molybdopterin oxidoreductase [Variibacter sp.]
MSAAPRTGFDLEAARRRLREEGGRRFWTSVDELTDDAGFRARLSAEFPSAAAMIDAPARRQFLKLMGASLLLMGTAACGDNRSDRARPYVDQPEGLVPGVPRRYATAVTLEGYAQPVLATTYDGRPTKLDGNPDHPATRGKSDAFMQAAIFGLYDPERSKEPTRNGETTTWGAVAAALVAARTRWQANGGEGLRFVMRRTTSPTLQRQFNALFREFPAARVHFSDAVGADERDAATTASFGRPLEIHYALDACDVVVSVDDDLVGPGPQQVRNALAWSTRRGDIAPGQGRTRLHAAESLPSLTGTVASTRLPANPSQMMPLLLAIAAALGATSARAPALSGHGEAWVRRAVADLRRHAGRGLVTAGAHLDPRLQSLAFAINAHLGNVGQTVFYTEPIHAAFDQAQPLDALAEDIAAGAVNSLVVLDANPAYDAAGALGLHNLIPKVATRIHAGLYRDETASLCEWHLPLAHALESWSDARAVDGTASIVQPVIALYSTRNIHQIVEMLNGDIEPAADSAVRETWRRTFGERFDARWRQSLHDGFVGGSQAQPVSVGASAPSPIETEASPGALEIVFRPDPTVWDGRFANIAWLQELPKPVTKITWDNVVAISPPLANKLHFADGQIVEVTAGDAKVKGPVWIVPGQAGNTVALYLGYGRRAGGEISRGIGYDAFALRPSRDRWCTHGRILRVEGSATVATTQAHHRMDGFDFVREVTADAPRTPPPKDQSSFYPEWNDAAHAWGMTIDLDRCIGCNACIAACNVENNVAVVGKDQVARGREMLWLRVDRYYEGDIENPRAFFQPVPCMHCEKAPCEMGCPVHATVHSPEGLNQMVYNRCIGTRTCSSYCPYKVRRFNWYDYRKFGEADRAAKNPDVTVRSRGVMEKCTYCTQRIQAAHVAADKENRALRDGDIVTACQQACPTTAITFGDIKDPNAGVSQRRKSGRHYVLLEEIGTRPRTTYLARWRDDGEAT